MKLQPWQVAVAPFGVLALIFLYLTMKADGEGVFIFYLVAMVVIAAVIYVMSPQINWWWWQRSPPPLDERTAQILADYCAFYRPLSPELKQRFRDRVALFMLGNAFMRPVHPSEMDADALRMRVPEDLKVAVATAAVQVSFGQPTFETTKFEHIILYPHPFPSPQFAAVHACEIYEPDGVVMLDADTLMAGFNQPRQIFSIGLYEMARIFKIITSREGGTGSSVSDDLKSLIGWSAKQKELLEDENAETLTDNWLTLARITEREDDLTIQRHYLLGLESHRFALILDFAFKNLALPTLLMPATATKATLVFQPSNALLRRAFIKNQGANTAKIVSEFEPLLNLTAAQHDIVQHLQKSPWADDLLQIIADLTLTTDETAWFLKDTEGSLLKVNPRFSEEKIWQLLAVSGGVPRTFAVLRTGETVLPLGVFEETNYQIL